MTAVDARTSTTDPLVVPLAHGDRSQADLLGGKGAGLAEMTRIGLPVPAGFVITTVACRAFLAEGGEPAGLWDEVVEALHALEASSGRRFGNPADPLLVSVRSGARFSMPGMMETVLDIGMTDEVARSLSEAGSAHFAWDTYRRLVQMYGRTVLGVDGARFDERLTRARADAGVSSDVDLSAETLRAVTEDFRAIVREHGGEDVPQDPMEQLHRAILAVFRSWNGERARLYRAHEGIPDDLGTAVNVVQMVYGNRGPRSGSGVCFTRDPATGAPGMFGDYLPNAQGEDVVSGVRSPMDLSELGRREPTLHDELARHLATLEDHYRDLCDVEFTVEEGRLWILQTRIGKRSPAAAFRIAVALVDEGVIDLDEALRRVTGTQLETLLHPAFRDDEEATVLARGTPASPGAAVGAVVFDSGRAAEWAAQGRQVVLARPETSPDDLGGMLAAEAVVTARGGVTSHAAVVARGLGKTCVTGIAGLDIDEDAGSATLPDGTSLAEGTVLSVDGTAGVVYAGRREIAPSPVATALHAAPGRAVLDDEIVGAVLVLLDHADRIRRLGVRANAETPEEARLARRLGAEGIGLARTEHMLLGPRRELVERLVTDDRRDEALATIESLAVTELSAIFEVMNGLPVTVRLLDPPMHEFLPDLVDLSVDAAVARERGTLDPALERRLAAVRRWHESNPMLGLRGVRILTVLPQIVDAQVRAVAEAAIALRARGLAPRPQVMIPLVAGESEVRHARERVESVIAEVSREYGMTLDIPVGVMIELPRAAVTAGDIARVSDFFSFGTNDLTQTTWGMSRDDAEANFLRAYRREGLIEADPFATIDEAGVGRLVRLAVDEGRAARPDLGLGVCGEHAGDAASVAFFARAGVDYLSCSPPRIPVVRLEAGRQAALARGGTEADTR